MKYGITSNLTLNATINPDFGQVEVDPAVVNLSAFETFFPERRPFFVEGASIFDFGSMRTFNSSNGYNFTHTRRIGRTPQRDLSDLDAEFIDSPLETTIAAAAKLTGRTKKGWSIGVLDAVTMRENARFRLPSGIDSGAVVEPPANYFVGRVKRDLRGEHDVRRGGQHRPPDAERRQPGAAVQELGVRWRLRLEPRVVEARMVLRWIDRALPQRRQRRSDRRAADLGGALLPASRPKELLPRSVEDVPHGPRRRSLAGEAGREALALQPNGAGLSSGLRRQRDRISSTARTCVGSPRSSAMSRPSRASMCGSRSRFSSGTPRGTTTAT